ncbi:phosphatase PAP2 family protein [Brevibacillus borstelensis]|uniref:phosphatase PAP2 family protein n=1 Tax=Brevibacillus borstelensis TaxID=45462 RepID=UPI0030C4E863
MKKLQITSLTKKYLIKSILALSVFIFIFTRFADEVMEQELTSFDHAVIHWIQSLISPQLTAIMKFFTFLGSTAALLALLVTSAVLMIWQKKRWEALFLVLALSGGVVFNQLLKWIFHRQRPNLHRLIEETGYSFPSGHSMSSIIFYGMLGMLFFMFARKRTPKIIITAAAIVLVLSIGISRIYLGVHYPSDVLAGFAAGGAWLTICLMGLKLVLELRRKT